MPKWIGATLTTYFSDPAFLVQWQIGFGESFNDGRPAFLQDFSVAQL
jgi:hypothetical protein